MTYNKYRNKKTVIDGFTFDSKKEANRYCELKLLKKAGEIEFLELQPRYLLQERFKDYSGKIQRKIEYVADFQYFEYERMVVEDVKGIKTDVYKLKKKLFLFKYPNMIFREI